MKHQYGALLNTIFELGYLTNTEAIVSIYKYWGRRWNGAMISQN